MNTTVHISKDKGVLEDAPLACGSSRKIENDTTHNSSKTDQMIANADLESGSVGKSLFHGENFEKIAVHVPRVLGVDLLVASPVLEKSKPMFLSKNWRDILCRCEKCMYFYNKKHIAFLLDKEDSIVEYEKMAKQKREEKLQQQKDVELNLLNKLGHVEKMEILNGIADIKNELNSFLPYSHDIIMSLPDICMAGQHIWRARVPLIWFELVELYLLDCVMRQFGFHQHIPEAVDTLDDLHRIDRRSAVNDPTRLVLTDMEAVWANCVELVVHATEVTISIDTYHRWYANITCCLISSPLNMEPDQPRLHYEAHGSSFIRALDIIERIAIGCARGGRRSADHTIRGVYERIAQDIRSAFHVIGHRDRIHRATTTATQFIFIFFKRVSSEYAT